MSEHNPFRELHNAHSVGAGSGSDSPSAIGVSSVVPESHSL